MGRPTDWLYQLVFQRVADLSAELRTEHVDSPDRFVVDEMSHADWDTAFCSGQVSRTWTHDSEGLKAGQTEEPAECRGMFFKVGLVRFHIAADRKRVLFEYRVGPRYGRGFTYRVVGQGKLGRLMPDGTMWVS